MDGIAWQEHYLNKEKLQLQHSSNTPMVSNLDIHNILMGQDRYLNDLIIFLLLS